jgi:hypothetical protein
MVGIFMISIRYIESDQATGIDQILQSIINHSACYVAHFVKTASHEYILINDWLLSK